LDNKAEIAAGACKLVSGCFLGIGAWMGEHWLQILSGFFLVLTYATQFYFHRRRDRREEAYLQKTYPIPGSQPDSGQS